MRTIAVAEVKQSFRQALKDSQKEVVIVTRHGKPVARLTGCEGEDMADLVMTSDPAFWEMLENAARGPRLSSAELRQQLGLRSKKTRRRHKR